MLDVLALQALLRAGVCLSNVWTGSFFEMHAHLQVFCSLGTY